MAANIQLKWGLSEYTPRALKQYSDKEVRKEYTRLRNAARKRLQRLEKAGYRFNKDRYEYIKNLNMDQLRRRLSELADFIESPASTLKGQERIHQKVAETLKERGINIGDSKQDLVRFGIYDTDLYRYVYECGWKGAVIRRIPITEVGTTSILDPDNWETVYPAITKED